MSEGGILIYVYIIFYDCRLKYISLKVNTSLWLVKKETFEAR